jgi:murein DD-endopeptidase MepM/ murein hydrolase activator NlpD
VHLNKRRGRDEYGRRIVERGDRSGKLTIEKGLISGAPVNPQRKPVVITGKRPEGQPAEPAVPAAAQPKQAGRRSPKVIRREDYADVYQVGRRVSSTQKVYRPSGEARGEGVRSSARSLRTMGLPFGRLPQQRSAGARPAPAAVAVGAKKKKFNPRALVVSLMGAAVVTAAVLGAFTLLQPKPALALGQEVYFDGRMLCIVQDREDVEQAMQKIQDDLKNEYGMDVQQTGELTFSPVLCDDQNILDGNGIEDVLKSNINAKVVAAVITVNGHPAVALRTEGEARQALDAVLQPYKDVPASRYRADISFTDDVQVSKMPIDYSLVQPLDVAIRTLSLGAGVEDNVYTVKKGDTLAKIAKKFGLKVSEIRKANPDLASTDVIKPGQTLNAVKPLSWVNVSYTEQVERQETLPYNTQEETDDSLYTTQTDVKQEGVNGKRTVWAKITYINGMESKEEVISQTVITPAQDRIVLRGTKKVQKSAGGSVGSGKFICPIKASYRISSTFGPRNLAGAASNYHYGTDLAAPTGTPIYASRAGTVTKSGSASGYGLVIYIDHGDGVQTRYGHCSRLLVSKGQKVSQGQLIALVGATGDATGPHLHFEIRINGTAVNPQKYVKLQADMNENLYYMENKALLLTA